MHEMEVFILKVKFPPQHLPSKGNINVCQILVISLKDEMSIVEEVLELFDTVLDSGRVAAR